VQTENSDDEISVDRRVFLARTLGEPSVVDQLWINCESPKVRIDVNLLHSDRGRMHQSAPVKHSNNYHWLKGCIRQNSGDPLRVTK
jgi:hypothetical protein